MTTKNPAPLAAEIVRTVEENYAGYQDKLAKHGAEILAAREKLLAADNTSHSLHPAIRAYLHAFHEGHMRLSLNTNTQLRITENTDWVWIRIPSFEGSYRDEIRNLLLEHQASITDGRPLVIDLRMNGGGDDSSYEPLLPYVMSGSFQQSGMEILSTPAIIASWERLLAPENHLSPNAIEEIQAQIAKLRANPSQFVRMGDNDTYQFDPDNFGGIFEKPEKVLIIQSKKTASSAEQFLLAARQSKKVVTIGENSAGMLDYANMRPFPLHTENLILYLGTTRSLRVTQGLDIDEIGIAPDISVDNTTLFDDKSLEAVIEKYLHQIKCGISSK